MKKLMLMCLVLMLATTAYGVVSRVEVVGGGDPATQEFARLRYDGSSVDLVGPSWLMIGDHIHGANHYSDGVTKINIPDEIPSSATIISARIEGYFHVNSGGLGHVYMALMDYAGDENPFDGPITWASDSPDYVATSLVTVLDFNGGEQNYAFDITADIAAKVAAGYDYASYAWQNSDAVGNPTPNGAEVPPTINMIGFCEWEWEPNLDKVALVVEWVPEPATMILLALGGLVVCRKRK